MEFLKKKEERAIAEIHRLKEMLESNPLLRRVTGGGDNTNRSTNTVRQKSCLKARVTNVCVTTNTEIAKTII